MVQLRNTLAVVAAFFAANPTLAHPGHSLDHEIAARSAYLKHAPRDLSHCAEKLKARGHERRAIERRTAKVQELRAEVVAKKKAKRAVAASTAASTPIATPSGGGGAPGDDATLSDWGAQVANTSHLSNLTVTPDMPGVEDLIFENSSCVLSPEGEIGPFYVLGELIREDIVDGEPGVPVTIDGQFIDINTCEPIPELYWDLWHCNSTGVYAGVIGDGNGNADDTSNLNRTFFRGIAKTDDDGVATFKSAFPGHYSGRATHIHVVTHAGATQLANGTLTGGNVTHIGQLFFDQDLIEDINTNVAPYNTNTIEIVDNADDRVFATETENESDPVFNYVKLSDDVEDGLFAWLAIGVDLSASYEASYAAVYGENGGTEA
ncbi:putative extracellular dioxygenase protein [Neofusicoccum parvum UCRNP2]|uniref:Extracellular dioxygenase n=2 Tax=Neofusicoccum parvum TaxID=310453 RepID=A0ACB5RZP4_9PEZI|nr:putative extracellular dioxygenase protein [Neofusicoccum parvum UCRNP2]GME25947.1 Extracellular dioxygenase [Neofusicoccum parvum]